MFGIGRFNKSDDERAILTAIDRSQAMIEFTMDGTIVNANTNFLTAMGYGLDEIRGRHHGMFVDPTYRDSADYRDFWARLNRGEFQSAEFKRIGKGGREVWIEASYNPVLGADGTPYKVVKVATEVSDRKAEYADLRGKVDAALRSLAVIEFTLEGKIITANQNFLDALGYTLADVQGRPHAMFVDPTYAGSADYRNFWDALRRGEFQADQFRRLGKGGKEVWIQASYNPIFDLNGKPVKVVKFAIDITKQIAMLGEFKHLIDKNFAEIEAAIGRSSGQAEHAADAVRETTGGIQGMAAATEQLATSVREIATMMERSRAATESVHSQTGLADEATRKLSETSNAMGDIVGLIREIAGQINLLALNATIESARAGDAGKGFAVVAGEVKSLAQQAANATSRIAVEIQKLHDVSGEVVGALGNISQSINQVREYVSGTASAVEEQSAVTQNVSSGMQSAVANISAINDNMGEIAAAVNQASHALSDTKAAAKVLAR